MNYKEWYEAVDAASFKCMNAYVRYVNLVNACVEFPEQEAAWEIYRVEREQFTALLRSTKDVLAKDAQDWGNALNDAGWEATDEYSKVMKHMKPENHSVAFFNYSKTIIRAAILKYIEKLS